MTNNLENIDLNQFPEHNLSGRGKLAYQWLDDNCDTLLDAGCSYGYTTRFFLNKSKKIHAIDIDKIHISIAKSRYPEINFSNMTIENLLFQNDFFDSIVFLDVLEHTSDKIKSLNEIFRVLKKGGCLIVSTPHKGLFGFLDPYNYGYYLKKNFGWLYKFLFKIVRFIKEGKFPESYNPVHEEKHYHYSLKDFFNMLDKSDFQGNYKIEKKFRSGLLIEVLTMNFEVILSIFLKKKYRDILLKPFIFLSDLDYFISYGALSYNIALKIRKI